MTCGALQALLLDAEVPFSFSLIGSQAGSNGSTAFGLF